MRWRSSSLIQARARQLRRSLTPAECKLWFHLRNAQLGAYFRRQHPIGRFVVDFYCAKANLVIELDGDSHAAQTEYDAERTRWLQIHKRCRVLRFTNREVFYQLQAVLDEIKAALDK
jgi:very-short-patch-repair endonuclease